MKRRAIRWLKWLARLLVGLGEWCELKASALCSCRNCGENAITVFAIKLARSGASTREVASFIAGARADMDAIDRQRGVPLERRPS